jgi:hypothetical protein
VLQADGNKHVYRVSFTMAAYSCRKFFWKRERASVALLGRILRYIEPIRKGRSDKRKVRTQTIVNFLYRVA